MLSNVHIYQIAYSEESAKLCSQGFLVLDNFENQRPDWREYWPIRQYLLNNELIEDHYYGFFSPRFFEKTGLSSKQVYKFIEQSQKEVDVIGFSPYFDQGAYALNIVEQSLMSLSGMALSFKEVLSRLFPKLIIQDLVMSANEMIFCNYFVAKPAFWRAWLKKCEQLFKLAERRNTQLGKMLTSSTEYEKGVEQKVFIMERMASLILATQVKWTHVAYNPLELPFSPGAVGQYREWLLALDAVKVMYSLTQNREYLKTITLIRNMLCIEMAKSMGIDPYWMYPLNGMSLYA